MLRNGSWKLQLRTKEEGKGRDRSHWLRLGRQILGQILPLSPIVGVGWWRKFRWVSFWRWFYALGMETSLIPPYQVEHDFNAFVLGESNSEHVGCLYVGFFFPLKLAIYWTACLNSSICIVSSFYPGPHFQPHLLVPTKMNCVSLQIYISWFLPLFTLYLSPFPYVRGFPTKSLAPKIPP